MPVSGGVGALIFNELWERDSCKRNVSVRMYLLLVEKCSFHSLSDQSGIDKLMYFFLLTNEGIVSGRGWIVIARGWMLNASFN